MLGCCTCGEEADHTLKYERHYNDYIRWEGDFCTSCLVKKLRGMAKVYSK